MNALTSSDPKMFLAVVGLAFRGEPQLTNHHSIYSPRPETATIAPSSFRQGFSMPSNGTATQAASEKNLYRIGEVSRLAALKPFVLRYWETEFPMLEPIKGSSGHRLYRQEDVDMVFRIKRLLYDEGFTIAGARRHLREHDGAEETERRSPHPAGEGSGQLLNRKMLLDLRDTLRAFLTLLERR
jgi:DNA-binding transcriptional MerR regulator